MPAQLPSAAKGRARRDPGQQVIAYRYGIPASARLPETAERQLILAAAFRSELCRLWDACQAGRDALYARDPVTAAAQVTAQAARDAVTALITRSRAERAADRSTIPRQETETEITAAKTASKAASACLKQARKTAEASLPGLKVQLAEAAARYQAAKTRARQDAADGGLYWGCYNQVLDAHRQAEKAVLARRAAGLPADISFRRPATLTVQLQRESGDPVRSPALLASGGGKWRNVLRLPDRPGHGTVAFAVGGGQVIELPVQVHRPLPDDADVCLAHLTRENTGHWRAGGPRYRLSLSVVFRTAAPPAPDPAGNGIMVRTGWAGGEVSLDSGRVRAWKVAEITPSGNLPPFPGHPAGFVLPSSGDTFWTAYLGPRVPGQLRKSDAIRGVRDELLHAAREQVTAELAGDDSLAAALAAALGRADAGQLRGQVARTRSSRFLARLVLAWQDLAAAGKLAAPRNCGDSHAMPAQRLNSCDECWRRRDAHLHSYEANLRGQALAGRRDFYRVVAHWAAAGIHDLAVSEIPVDRIRRKPRTGEDTRQDRGSRRSIQFTAPHELRQALENAARRAGAQVMTYTEREPERVLQPAA